MDKHLILTIISDDKPGVVKQIAQIVSDHKGNWLESQLSKLAGKFAGVVLISAPTDSITALESALIKLSSNNIRVQLEELEKNTEASQNRLAKFSVAGPDRQGIVLEITQAFTKYNINVENLNTHCSSMPYSGDPLFEAVGSLSLPKETQLEQLIDQLDIIADNLGLDLTLNEDG